MLFLEISQNPQENTLSESDNKEIMICFNTEWINEQLFDLLLHRYQLDLE